MSMHVQSVEDTPMPAIAAGASVDAVFFVIQRANGSWSPGAKIISVHSTEMIAEAHAAKLMKDHPKQTFGVAMLRSEAREVMNPIEIVRVIEGGAA